MKLDGLKIHKNKVWEYLMLPVLRAYGEDFRVKISNLYKIGAYIGGLNNSPYLALAINVTAPNPKIQDQTYKMKLFEDFIEWFEIQDFCMGHYPYEGPLNCKDKYHIFKIAIPKELTKTLGHFVKGEYSKMYSEKQIEEHFTVASGAKVSDTHIADLAVRRKVLRKDPELIPSFIAKVNERFKTSIGVHEIDPSVEVELPPSSAEDFLIEEETQKLLEQ